jgi:predicted nucleic acid-binding protein
MVKVLFDTSVLVAASIPEHPHHSHAFLWLQRIQQNQDEGFVSTHTVAELYSILTRFPRTPRINPSTVQQLITHNLRNFTKVELTFQDYQEVIERMVRLNLTGGTIFDTLIAQAAIKAKVSILLTLNTKDFNRLGEDIASLVETPI